MKAYAEYKPSGVEWLGDVPSHWKAVKFGQIFTENKIKNKGMIENNLLSLSYGNIIEKNIENAKGLVPENFETYQIVNPNDIIFRFTDLQNDKRSLRSAISKFRGIITSAYISVKLKKDGNADFFNYLFRAYDLMKVFYSMGDGMRQSLKMEELNRLVLFIPSETEQQKIVDYLDRQTARIDTLIAEQNRLIELLAEQRKAVISHAVTSGINPNATMKKSGVEWLGDVPSHWEIKRLKYVSNINLQTLPENTDKNAVIQYVDIGSVSLEKGIEKVEKFIFGEAPSRARRMAKTGDIVVSTVRTYLKAIATVTDEFKDCIFSTGFAVVSSKGNINSRYLTNCLKSDSFTNQVTFYSKGLSYPAINSSDLSNLYIAIPPLSEQNEIVAYIEKQTAQIDALIAEQNRLIDRLTQYRASLISAAVTGKIDVQAA